MRLARNLLRSGQRQYFNAATNRSDSEVDDYIVVPTALSPIRHTTYAVSFLWLSGEGPRAYIADKSWYNAIQSDLGGEWDCDDLNACGIGIRTDKMISTLWTWGKSTKSVNQQDILDNLDILQTMLEAWCRLSVLSPENWWRVAPLMQVGKEVWVRFGDQECIDELLM